MRSHPSINIARLTYLLVCEGVGVAIAIATRNTPFEVSLSTGILSGLALAGVFIWMETLMRGFTLRGFSTATFGLGVGLLCAWLLTRVQLTGLLEIAIRDWLDANGVSDAPLYALRIGLDTALYASFGFLGTVLSLRGNRDDFAFVIPYVRFRQDTASGQPVILDVEAVIDGRVLGILRSGFLHGRLIVPRFVLNSLQEQAKSTVLQERQRAQRGLDALDALKQAREIQVSIHDTEQVDGNASQETQLIETAKVLGARLMTLDPNLTKIAKLRGVDVLNLLDLDEALKPAVAIGQRFRIALVRGGREDHQAVGYLSDGSMVVVNHATGKIGSTCEVVIVTTLQTSSGLMAFAELG